VHGRDGEEAAVAGLAERLPRVAGEQERARQQDREQRLPALLGELRDRGDVLKAGACDDRVDAAEALERRVEGRAGLSTPASTAARFPAAVARSASNGSPGPSGSGRTSTASTA
jgi:hypothetical protein